MRLFSLLLSAAVLALVPAMADAVAAAVKAPAANNAASDIKPAVSASPSVAAPATSQPSTFSDAQRGEIESILKEYLTKKNPEVLMEAMTELQKRQVADSDAKSKAAVATNHDKIYNDPNSPTGGNEKGSIVVVEFFDYQCGYCKMSEPHVEKLLKENKEVKFIYKEFPILGPTSTQASKAALAAARQGKYIKFHNALMAAPLPHGVADPKAVDEVIFKAAKDAGLDVEKLKKDMADDAIAKMVETNVAVGTEIGARGTPTFVIADKIYPGAMEYEQLKKAVDDANPADAKKP